MDYTRRISLEDDFMNHETNDLLFAYMLSCATFHPIEKRLYLTKAKYAGEKMAQTIAKLCGKSQKTITRHLSALIEKGLVAEDVIVCGDKKVVSFVFPFDKDMNYQIVNNDMLKYVIHTRNQCAVRIYVYLLNKYLWKPEYHFTSKELQVAIGYSANTETSSIYEMIRDILESFKREGIIEYDEVYETLTNFETGEVINTPNKVLKFVAQKKDELSPSRRDKVDNSSSGTK